MKVDISFLDDVSLARIFRSCSDRTIACLLISVESKEVPRLLKIVSKEHKIAIQAELQAFERSYMSIEREIQVFWAFVKSLQESGEIMIIRRPVTY